MKAPILFSAKDIHYTYRLEGQAVRALNGVSLDLPTGKVVCLSGPSGSGKSTLLNLMGLLDKPTQGELYFAGQKMSSLKESEREAIRLFQMGFVFQSFNLFPALTAEENVEYFLVKQKLAKKERGERVKEALTAVGIWDQRKKFPHQMSGGQRQRVAVARTLAKKPKVILADEPTASLDQKNGREVIDVFKRLSREFGLAVIVASHDAMVMEQADHNVRMIDGTIGEGALA